MNINYKLFIYLIALCFLLGKCEVMKILTMCFRCVIPYKEIDPCVPLRGCTPSGVRCLALFVRTLSGVRPQANGEQCTLGFLLFELLKGKLLTFCSA